MKIRYPSWARMRADGHIVGGALFGDSSEWIALPIVVFSKYVDHVRDGMIGRRERGADDRGGAW